MGERCFVRTLEREASVFISPALVHIKRGDGVQVQLLLLYMLVKASISFKLYGSWGTFPLYVNSPLWRYLNVVFFGVQERDGSDGPGG
jgi:hypothetical protein